MDLPSLEEEREVPLLRVEDAMRPPLGQTLTGKLLLHEARQRVQGSAQDYFVVGMGGDEWSGMSRAVLLDMIPNSDIPLSQVLTARIPYLHPDHPLDTALRLIGGRPMLPVVHRAHVQQLLGVVSLDDVMRAYRGAGINESHPEPAPVVP
jgi:CBS domain-containing protein